MDDLYRDYILEHYRRPHNFGVLESPSVSVEGHNPLCGDRITLQLGVHDGIVERVAFTGRGCAISQASASLLTDEIKGKPLAVVAAFRADDLLELLGIEISPARLKCAMLSHDTLRRALDELASGAASDGTNRGANDAGRAAEDPSRGPEYASRGAGTNQGANEAGRRADGTNRGANDASRSPEHASRSPEHASRGAGTNQGANEAGRRAHGTNPGADTRRGLDRAAPPDPESAIGIAVRDGRAEPSERATEEPDAAQLSGAPAEELRR